MQVIGRERLDPGEYRSHVYFRAVPNEMALGEIDPNADTTMVSIRLIPIFGITIPVIIRVGESTTKVFLSDLKLSDNEEGQNFWPLRSTVPAICLYTEILPLHI